MSPDRPIDPQDPAVHSDLWLRIRNGFAMPTLDNALVRKWERYYAERPDYVQRMIDRGSRYLYHVVEEVEKRGMPTELALLPFVESAFNPQAQSVARASGMWQFIPSTGRLYQLRQNAFRDDRRDVLASTRAALDFLQSLYERFGDWHLALAAYNWGPGSVARAITANQRARKPTDYEHLRMPHETRNYLPKLQAVRNMIGAPQDHGLDLPPLDNHPYFLSVPIARDIDIDLAARLAEVPLEEFQYLNPQLNRPLILAAGTARVLLPYDNANAFARNLAEYKGRLSSWAVWVAPRTAKSAEVARQIGISESQLREVNQIPPNMLVRAGSTLVVPRMHDKHGDVASHIAQNGMLNLSPEFPPLRRIKIRAGKGGTTVAEVAQKYRMSVQQVAQLNRVAEDASFKAGQAIVVTVPGKSSAVRTSAKPARRGGTKAAAPTRRVAQPQR